MTRSGLPYGTPPPFNFAELTRMHERVTATWKPIMDSAIAASGVASQKAINDALGVTAMRAISAQALGLSAVQDSLTRTLGPNNAAATFAASMPIARLPKIDLFAGLNQQIAALSKINTSFAPAVNISTRLDTVFRMPASPWTLLAQEQQQHLTRLTAGLLEYDYDELWGLVEDDEAFEETVSQFDFSSLTSKEAKAVVILAVFSIYLYLFGTSPVLTGLLTWVASPKDVIKWINSNVEKLITDKDETTTKGPDPLTT